MKTLDIKTMNIFNVNNMNTEINAADLQIQFSNM